MIIKLPLFIASYKAEFAVFWGERDPVGFGAEPKAIFTLIRAFEDCSVDFKLSSGKCAITEFSWLTSYNKY